MTLAFLSAAAVHLSYSMESNGDRTLGYFVLFQFSNMLQLGAITSIPKIIIVVVEAVQLVKPT